MPLSRIYNNAKFYSRNIPVFHDVRFKYQEYRRWCIGCEMYIRDREIVKNVSYTSPG